MAFGMLLTPQFQKERRHGRKHRSRALNLGIAASTVPVLVIHGTRDETVPIEVSGRPSAKLLPNATLSEYEGEPHGLFLTAADKLNQELLQFAGGPREPISSPAVA